MSFVIDKDGEYLPVLGEPPAEGTDFDVVTVLTSGATDTQVPSAKLMYNVTKNMVNYLQYGTITIEI